MNIAIITGITGQDGSYLSELLLEKNYIVYGVIRRSSTINTQRIDHLYQYNSEKFILRYGDLTEPWCIVNILSEIENKYSDINRIEIYNLGAMSHVKISFEIPEYTVQTDGVGTLRILEAIRHSNLKDKIRFYQASTSELYGKVLEIPQSETTPFNPCSPYAIAKLYSFYITKNYRESYNIFACNGILFNHEGPRRGHNFITRKVTMGLAKILQNPDEVLQIGNLNSLRDWGHAKEYVYGMWLMLQQENPDDYVLATGEQHSVREFIELAFSKKGLNVEWRGEGIDEKGYDRDTNRLLVEVNPRYYRPCEVETLLGNPTKAKELLGWEPKILFRELVEEMVEYDCKDL